MIRVDLIKYVSLKVCPVLGKQYGLGPNINLRPGLEPEYQGLRSGFRQALDQPIKLLVFLREIHLYLYSFYRKNPNEILPMMRTFKVPNVDKVIEEGKKVATKFRNISLCHLGVEMQTDLYTATGWPSVSGDALKALAGKVSADIYEFESDEGDEASSDLTIYEVDEEKGPTSRADDVDTSVYGKAFHAFGEGKEGMEACHAIAALCEVCSIDSLISNFILPLQVSYILNYETQY